MTASNVPSPVGILFPIWLDENLENSVENVGDLQLEQEIRNVSRDESYKSGSRRDSRTDFSSGTSR